MNARLNASSAANRYASLSACSSGRVVTELKEERKKEGRSASVKNVRRKAIVTKPKKRTPVRGAVVKARAKDGLNRNCF